MIDPRGGTGLVREAVHHPPPFLVLGVLAQPEFLDGDVPSLPLVESPPHGAVGPGPDPPDKPVTPIDQTSVGRVFAAFAHGT